MINYDETIKTPAVAKKIAGVFSITCNPKITSMISLAGNRLITYHELGHLLLGHNEIPLSSIAGTTRSTVNFSIESRLDHFFHLLHNILTKHIKIRASLTSQKSK